MLVTFESTSSPENGTTAHTIQMPAGIAPGSLLVLLYASASYPVDPSGWTEVLEAASIAALTMYTRVADGSETDFVLNTTVSNVSVEAVVLVLPPTAVVSGFGEQDSASNPGPTLSSMSGDPFVCFVQSYPVTGTPAATPQPYVDSPAGFTLLHQHFIARGANDGAGIGVLVADTWDADTTPSISPTILTVDTTGLSTPSRAGFWVTGPETLDTPVVTVVEGSTVQWDPVPEATRYQAGYAEGFDQTTGFTIVEENATSPYTFEGLPTGEYTAGIRAVKE